ncbi:MAG: sporulation transcriptional regulator SpoIIID [Eubacteriales bacterium]|nr:sporulation transcriptional regulator SpoIIID [Eubacteriales bacterium]
MKGNVEERAKKLGEYIAKTNATVRLAAKKYNISKSTVHKDVSERLKYINYPLYKEVRKVLDTNKEERHIRGGIATKKKYQKSRKNADRT